MRVGVIVLSTLLMASAVASAGVVVFSEVGNDGTVPLMTPVTFHTAAIDGNGVPMVHSDAPMRVLLNGDIVYESTSNAHEYDGLHTATLMFGQTGTYLVQAIGADGVVDEVSGTVVGLPVEESILNATVAPEGDSSHVAFTAELPGSWPHSEAFTRLSDGGSTLLRTHLHSHADPITMTMAPAIGGQLDTVHAFLQAGEGPTFEPVQSSLEIPGNERRVPNVASLAGVMPPGGRNTVTVTEGDGMRLAATFDPYTVVGPNTLMRIAILAIDPETDKPLAHTQFSATLTGPSGRLWLSESIHEHDGVWEFASRQAQFGKYTLEVTAEYGDAMETVRANYFVIPPVEARSAGPHDVVVQVPEQWVAGRPADVLITITSAAGTPFDHGEVELDVLNDDGIPVLTTKIHAHGSGAYPIRFAVPEPGNYTLRVDAFPLEARPVTFTGDLLVALVATAPDDLPLEVAQEKASPGAPVLLLVVALVFLGRVRRP